jgi:hypothetical protein
MRSAATRRFPMLLAPRARMSDDAKFILGFG